MNLNQLVTEFDRIGSRIQITVADQPIRALSIDIEKGDRDEFFVLNVRPSHVATLDAMDVQPKIHHLLLETKLGQFLCGRDESHWFVAAIPKDLLRPTFLKRWRR